MKFWDSSAIIPLCLQDPRTTLLRKLTGQDSAIVAWWITPIECYSAFARLRREGLLSDQAEQQARQVITRLSAEWTEIQPSRALRDHAARALLLHPLRAADALQLAAALIWANGHGTGHDFVCLDQRLREAAQREGFRVIPS